MNTYIATTPSVLAHLRRLVPTRGCTIHEARRVAETQATRLGEIIRRSDPDGDGIQVRHIAALPRTRVAYEPLPVSGLSHWNGREWVIVLNEADSPARQRFTLLHEFKHILDHGVCDRLYRDTTTHRNNSTAKQQAERAADYFAGCALIPKRDLKRAWGSGLQRLDVLADHFGVSQHAMQVRLDQTGLSRDVDRDPESEERQARCARPVSTPRWEAQRFRVAAGGYGGSPTLRVMCS